MTYEPGDSPGPVIRDKRRFDPETGARREPQATSAPDAASAASTGAGRAADGAPPVTGAADTSLGADRADGTDARSDAEAALAERTADLQRLQAEYVNYKRRVDRDREVARDAAKVSVLTALLPVLDDIGRAREHGELTGGFKAVAESLERTVTGLGLVPFGDVGDAFDPHRHEALMHSYADDVSAPVCRAILQVGYQFGERVIRPARVAVAEPTEASIAGLSGVGDTDPDAVTAASREAASAEVEGPDAGGAEPGGREPDGVGADTSPTDGESVSESSGAAGRGGQTS